MKNIRNILLLATAIGVCSFAGNVATKATITNTAQTAVLNHTLDAIAPAETVWSDSAIKKTDTATQADSINTGALTANAKTSIIGKGGAQDPDTANSSAVGGKNSSSSALANSAAPQTPDSVDTSPHSNSFLLNAGYHATKTGAPMVTQLRV